VRTSPLSLIASALLPAFALGLTSAPAAAGEPTASELIALAPTISSSDKAIRSIEVAGYDQADGRIYRTFRALYRAPDRFAFVVRDGLDGTPVTIAVDKKLMVYDPVRPEILVFPHVSSYRVLGVEGGIYEDSWGAKLSGREPNQILIDLKSVFTSPPSKDGLPARETVVREGEGRYVLIRKEDKAYKRLHVDLSRSAPILAYETSTSVGGPPGRCLDRIIVNGALDDSEFAFPPLDGLAGTLKVREVEDGLWSTSGALNDLMRTYYVRETLHEPKSRRGVITPLLAGVRWSRVEENDERYAKRVRDLIPPDPIQRVAAPPVKADDTETVKRTGFDAIRDHLPRFPYKIKFSVKVK